MPERAFTESTTETEPELTPAQKKWAELEDRFRHETDGLDKGIEPGILDVVVGLNALGINTYQSCEGHLKKASRISPWVEVEVANQPEQLWEKSGKSEKVMYLEMGISEDLLDTSRRIDKKFRRMVKQRGIDPDDARERKTLIEELLEEFGISKAEARALRKASREVDQERHRPTKELVAWMKENEKVVEKAKKLLDEFNAREDIPEEAMLVTRPRPFGLTIYNGPQDYEQFDKKRTPKEKEELAKRFET